MADSENDSKVGCSMLQALHDKYSDDEPLDFAIFVPKSAPGREGTKIVIFLFTIKNIMNYIVI